MKYRAGIIFVTALIFFCNGLSFANTVDYFPHSLNANWQYKLPLLKGASMSITMKIISSDINQYGNPYFMVEEKSITSGPGVSMSNTIKHVYAKDISNNDLLEYGHITINEFIGEKDINYDPPWVILKYPLQVGASWLVGVDDRDGTEFYSKVIKFETVKTKAGTFKNCAKIKEVVYVGGNKNDSLEYLYWYAPNVGLVKGTMVGELKSYKIPSPK